MNVDFASIMDQMASLQKQGFKGMPAVRTMPVQETSDLKRIVSLPRRRPPTFEEQVIYAKYMTEMLRWERKSTCECKELRPNVPNPCIKELLPVQGWYLYEAMTGGVLGHIVVGGGKCLAAGSEIFDTAAGWRRDISECPSDAGVMSIGRNGLENTAAQGFPSGAKACWRVLLADGSSLDASYNHPILTPTGYVFASALTSRNLVAVPTYVPGISVITKMRDEEVKLVAYLLSDGGVNGGMARFTNATTEALEEFKCVADIVCGGWSAQNSDSAAEELSVSREFGHFARSGGCLVWRRVSGCIQPFGECRKDTSPFF